VAEPAWCMRLPGQVAFACGKLRANIPVVLCCLQDKLWHSLRGACKWLANQHLPVVNCTLMFLLSVAACRTSCGRTCMVHATA
jgi:hypothetical protein